MLLQQPGSLQKKPRCQKRRVYGTRGGRIWKSRLPRTMQPALPIPECIPVLQLSEFLLKPQLQAEQGESLQANLFPRPHRITLATRSWGDMRSRCIPSCLTPLQPALFFWDDSLVLLTGAGRTLEHTQPRRQGKAASGSNYPSALVSVTHSFCKEPFPVSAIALS